MLHIMRFFIENAINGHWNTKHFLTETLSFKICGTAMGVGPMLAQRRQYRPDIGDYNGPNLIIANLYTYYNNNSNEIIECNK